MTSPTASPACDVGVDAVATDAHDEVLCTGHRDYVLRLADGAMVFAQRLSEWVGGAPTLEEEMAIANIALDLLGQATLLYGHAAALEGRGRSADDFAFLRDEREYRNPLIVELECGDFAHTMLRLGLYEAYLLPLWEWIAERSVDATLRGIGGKARKECAYHWRHASEWIRRLGGGTEESRRRLVAALDELWPYTGELVEDDDVDVACSAAAIAPANLPLRDAWHTRITGVLAGSGIDLPADTWTHTGGRRGIHTESLGYLLATMQHLQRAHPGATW